MLLSNEAKFQKFRDKTKIVEMILGTLVLASGFTLFFMNEGDAPTWLYVKIGLVFAGIPIAIIGMKKANKALALLAVLLFLYVFAIGFTKKLSLSTPDGVVDETRSEVTK